MKFYRFEGFSLSDEHKKMPLKCGKRSEQLARFPSLEILSAPHISSIQMKQVGKQEFFDRK